MLTTAASPRQGRLLTALAVAVAMLASMLAHTSTASAATATVDVKVIVDSAVVKDTLLGAIVTVKGKVKAVTPDIDVDLHGQTIVVSVNGYDLLCVVKTSLYGTFTCNAFVNNVVQALICKVGLAVRFVGGTVYAIIKGVKCALQATSATVYVTVVLIL